MVSLKEKKQALFKILDPFFKEKGFDFINKTPNEYIKISQELVFTLWFDFKTRSDFHESTPLGINHIEVEELLFEIGKPNVNYEIIKKDIYSYRTVRKEFSEDYQQKFSQINLKTVEGFEQWGHLILEYMEGEGKAFMEHYSYLPNVLKEMDRLEAEGKYWKEILVAGSPIWFFRGLIISKLCNDFNFSSKKKWVDIFFNDAQYELEEWLPYYEKLKKRLETLEPIYNPY